MCIVDYIGEKELLLSTILENTKAQTVAIEADELETLEALIRQRAEMMQEVDKLDRQVSIAELPSSKGGTDATKSLLAQTITIDNANQELMKKGMQGIGKELTNIKAEIRTIRERRQQEAGYAPEYGFYKEEGIFFDTKE